MIFLESKEPQLNVHETDINYIACTNSNDDTNLISLVNYLIKHYDLETSLKLLQNACFYTTYYDYSYKEYRFGLEQENQGAVQNKRKQATETRTQAHDFAEKPTHRYCPSTKKSFEYIFIDYVKMFSKLNEIEFVEDVCMKETDSSNFRNKSSLLDSYKNDFCSHVFQNSLLHFYFKYDADHSMPNRNNESFEDALFSNLTSNLDIHDAKLSRIVDIIKHSNRNCTFTILDTLIKAQSAKCEHKRFVDSISHYDCASNKFSVKSSCDQCRVSFSFHLKGGIKVVISFCLPNQSAYRKWLCSNKIPYYLNETLIKPCQTFCYDVQNQCPFFRPLDDFYAGQPVFHCNHINFSNNHLSKRKFNFLKLILKKNLNLQFRF
jgi:hypothetical protein